MAKLTRILGKIFGVDAGPDEIGEFGSLAAGTPTTTTDPAEMQSLSNWLGGWYAAVLGNNSPAIEDMNAVHYVMSYQIAYMLQQGVAEWDTTTSYYIGSLVSSGGVLYVSKSNDNLGNALTSQANWGIYGACFRTVTANYTAVLLDDVIAGDATSAPGPSFTITITLPAVASTPVGKKFTVKNVSTSPGCLVVLKGNGSEIIEGANTYTLQPAPPVAEALTVINNGTQWLII